MTANSIEESEALTLDFNTLAKVAEVPGVLPCAMQNADTGEVILVAYVNEPAIACCAAMLPIPLTPCYATKGLVCPMH